MMLKLKLQYFGHLMWRVDSLGKRLWCWEGLGAGGEGDDRGWEGWMASLTQWTWVWVNFGRWWWTGRPGVLRFMGSQRLRHDWATELNWSFHTNYLISLFWCSMHFNFTMLCFLPFAAYDLSSFIKSTIISCSSQYVRLFHHFSLSLTGISQIIIDWYYFPSKICSVFTMTIISIHHHLSPNLLQ